MPPTDDGKLVGNSDMLGRETVVLTPPSIIKYLIKTGKIGGSKEQSPKPIKPDIAAIPFPVEIIAGFARRFAEQYAKVLEPRIPAFYMSALTCLGTLLAGKIRLNSELKTDPRLFVVFIGESGSAKKSTAAKFTIEFFTDYIKAFRSCEGAGSAEGLFNEINSVKWDRRLLLFYDEFQQFVNKCKIESSVLLQMVNILFENNKYESPLKKDKMKLNNTYLSLLSASTEETYDECWTSTFTNIGFNNRLFIVPIASEREHALPKMIAPDIKNALSDDINNIIGMVGPGKIYNITEDAFEYYERWYRAIVKSRHSNRIDTYALRFMSLLAANEMKSVVDLDIVKKVITLCDWQLKVRQRYEPTVADNQYAAMEAKIRKTLIERPMGLIDLQKRTNAYRVGIKTYRNALENMCQMNEIYLGSDQMYHIRDVGARE